MKRLLGVALLLAITSVTCADERYIETKGIMPDLEHLVIKHPPIVAEVVDAVLKDPAVVDLLDARRKILETISSKAGANITVRHRLQTAIFWRTITLPREKDEAETLELARNALSKLDRLKKQLANEYRDLFSDFLAVQDVRYKKGPVLLARSKTWYTEHLLEETNQMVEIEFKMKDREFVYRFGSDAFASLRYKNPEAFTINVRSLFAADQRLNGELLSERSLPSLTHFVSSIPFLVVDRLPSKTERLFLSGIHCKSQRGGILTLKEVIQNHLVPLLGRDLTISGTVIP